MKMTKRMAFGGLSILLVLGIVASLLFTFAANPNQVPPGFMDADEAKSAGLEEAKFAGLVGDPSEVTTTFTNLGEYTRISSGGTGELGADGAAFGLEPDRKVWVVAFEGDVRLSRPGGDGKRFDNITFALDAKTGDVISVNAYVDGKTAAPYLQ